MRRFERAYYFHGEDDYRKDVAVRELIDAAVDSATRDFNFDLIRGNDVTPEALEAALNTPPMMANRRVVVVRDVGALKKDPRAVLSRYLAHPAVDTVLLLIAQGGAKQDKEIEGAAVSVAFDVLNDTTARDWIESHTKSLGVRLSPAAVTLLVQYVGPDAGQLASELDKLASYSIGSEIDPAAVREVVGVREGGTLGDFLDHVAARDLEKALELVDHTLALPKSGLVPVLMALTIQVLAMGWARHAHDRGVPAHRLESEFFALLKETGAFPMRPWGEAAKSWARHVSKWDSGSIERAVAVLLSADRSAKDTHISSDEQTLASIVCALCAPSSRSAA